jgi:hypothetical protein
VLLSRSFFYLRRQIVGMDAIMTEAIATKFMSGPLTKEQIAELVRMPIPPE